MINHKFIIFLCSSNNLYDLSEIHLRTTVWLTEVHSKEHFDFEGHIQCSSENGGDPLWLIYWCHPVNVMREATWSEIWNKFLSLGQNGGNCLKCHGQERPLDFLAILKVLKNSWILVCGLFFNLRNIALKFFSLACSSFSRNNICIKTQFTKRDLSEIFCWTLSQRNIVYRAEIWGESTEWYKA